MHKVSLLFLILCTYNSLNCLNRFNYLGYAIPELSASWEDGSSLHSIFNSHLSSNPIFSFNMQQFKPFYLQNNATISFRNNPQKHVSTTLLEQLLTKGIDEIRAHKKELTHFHILQKKNFNWRRCCGLLVLKFKQYPFVVKLFIETPVTFTNPYCKGIEPICLFYMGAGASRHLTGLMRIKNLININQRIKAMNYWNEYVETPRKWLVIPKQNRWMHIQGKNIDGIPLQKTTIPSVYALIADYIQEDESITIPSNKRKAIIMRLCNDLDYCVDPHDKNYIFRRNEKNNKLKIFIIDTEHFPTMVGNTKKQFNSYTDWYLHLAWKCFEDTYLFSKEKRKIKIQQPLPINNILANHVYA